MPETACLHIESPGSDTVRVVDLPGSSVRIGRAAYCDVRFVEPGLADEECRLRRRGGTWQLVPVSPRNTVSSDGQPLGEPVSLTFGTSFTVGTHRVTLRASSSSPWPDLSTPADGPSVAQKPVTPVRSVWASTDRRLDAERETKRWESRWRAAGEKLRASASTSAAVLNARTATPPTAPERVRRTAPLRDATVHRPSVRRETPVAPNPPRPVGYVSPASLIETARAADWVQSPGGLRVPSSDPRSQSVNPPVTRPTIVREVARPVEVVLPTPEIEVLDVEPQTIENVLSSPATASLPTYFDQLDPAHLENDLRAAHSAIETDDFLTNGRVGQPGATHHDITETPEIVTEIEPEEMVGCAALTHPMETITIERVGQHSATRHEITEIAEADLEIEPSQESVDCVALTHPTEAPETESPAEVESEPLNEPAVIDSLSKRLHRLFSRRATVINVPSEDSETPSTPTEAVVAQPPEPVEEEEQDDEARALTRPVLGSARQVERKPEASTRWIFHKPLPKAEAEVSDRIQTEPVAEASWSYQTRFVTDTNFIEPGEEIEAASIVTATGPVRDRYTGWSDDGTQARFSRDHEATLRDWPTVSDILASQGVRTKPATDSPSKPKKRAVRRPEPTVAREPSQWRLPIWMAWLPGTSLTLAVGLAGMTGAWAWAVDGYNAGVIAPRLLATTPAKTALPKGIVPPEGGWWRSNASHLVAWAAYYDRSNDPAQAEDSRGLLDRAALMAPLNPSVRYTFVRPFPDEKIAPEFVLARSVAQTRDVPALTRAGHELLAAGKTAPALNAYKMALVMATRDALERPGVPSFLDDSQFRRYNLPGEDLLASVVRDMAGSKAWTYAEWSNALPKGTPAHAIAARALLIDGHPDATAALDAAFAEAEAPSSESGQDEAVRLAAGAEVLAIKGRWKDAKERYKQAVEQMPIDVVRRAWFLNMADLANRLDLETERQDALQLAKVADMKDEITRRAIDIQKAVTSVAKRAGGRVAGTVQGARR